MTRVTKEEGTDASSTNRSWSRRSREPEQASFMILFSLSNTKRSWFSTTRSQDQPDEFILLILRAEQPPGRELPGSITAVEVGKGEDQWPSPRLRLSPGDIFESEFRMLPGRATGAEMMSAAIGSMSTLTFVFSALCILRWKSINPLSRWN